MKKSIWGKRYNFKEYYGLPIDQPVDGKMMKELQDRILSDEENTGKFNAMVSLFANGRRTACETFDCKEKEELCKG